ncbi:hypothetical protein [Pontiella desulfatans]|uniref:hypothetical protein n=1 Tax=Pontiella desulfatans TaxID=2750659 RepID=UPI0014447746|nr:hypothetical protein [Pontiella desulfatans]
MALFYAQGFGFGVDTLVRGGVALDLDSGVEALDDFVVLADEDALVVADVADAERPSD